MGSMPFSNNIKLHDDMDNIIKDNKSLANRAFEEAKEFIDAAIINYRHMIITPAYTNSAFACELLFKSLLHYHNITVPKTHKIKDLFLLLPCEIKENIKTNIIFAYEPCENFELILEELSEAFVFARYNYTRKRGVYNIQNLLDIIAFVYKVAKKQIMPELEEK